MRAQGGKAALSRELYSYIISKDGHVISKVTLEKVYRGLQKWGFLKPTIKIQKHVRTQFLPFWGTQEE